VRARFSPRGRGIPAARARWGGARRGQEDRHHRVLRLLSDHLRTWVATNPRLSYNEPTASVFPFVVERVFDTFPDEVRGGSFRRRGRRRRRARRAMVGSVALRGAFRRAFMENIGGASLSFLYLDGLPDGLLVRGEASFLSRVLPRVGGWGEILDAGGGRLCGLILSSRGPVTYVDFSPFRAVRGAAIARHHGRIGASFVRCLTHRRGVGGLRLALDRSLSVRVSHEVTLRGGAILPALSADLGPFDGAILTTSWSTRPTPRGYLPPSPGRLRQGRRSSSPSRPTANGIVGRAREEEEGIPFRFCPHRVFSPTSGDGRMADRAGWRWRSLSTFPTRRRAVWARADGGHGDTEEDIRKVRYPDGNRSWGLHSAPF